MVILHTDLSHGNISKNAKQDMGDAYGVEMLDGMEESMLRSREEDLKR